MSAYKHEYTMFAAVVKWRSAGGPGEAAILREHLWRTAPLPVLQVGAQKVSNEARFAQPHQFGQQPGLLE